MTPNIEKETLSIIKINDENIQLGISIEYRNDTLKGIISQI